MNNEIFVDTFYLVARLNPQDQWHLAALDVAPLLKDRQLVTTETVLIELLNYLAYSGFASRVQVFCRRAGL
jgi:predicted nucleic acid-binding protein